MHAVLAQLEARAAAERLDARDRLVTEQTEVEQNRGDKMLSDVDDASDAFARIAFVAAPEHRGEVLLVQGLLGESVCGRLAR